MREYDIDDLFPPSTPPATSRAAAAQIAEDAETLRQRVLAAIRAAGEAGMTDEEIQTELHMSGNTERPRRWELAKICAIRRAGRTRKTTSGREADVWIATGRPLNAAERSWWEV